MCDLNGAIIFVFDELSLKNDHLVTQIVSCVNFTLSESLLIWDSQKNTPVALGALQRQPIDRCDASSADQESFETAVILSPFNSCRCNIGVHNNVGFYAGTCHVEIVGGGIEWMPRRQPK